MLFYYSIAITAALLALGATRFKGKSSLVYWICIAAIVALYCCVAGFRATSVGTDTNYYGVNSFAAVSQESFLTFFTLYYRSWGLLYKFMAWAIINLTHSFFWYLFVIEFLTVVPMLWAAEKLTGKYFPVAVAIFGLVFFPISFNLMRQMIAMSFLLVAYVYLERGKPLGFLGWLVVATLFHNVVLIGALLYPLFAFGKPGYFSPSIKFILLSIFVTLLIVVSPRLFAWLVGTTGYYTEYYTGSGYTQASGGMRSGIELLGVFVSLGFLAACLLWRKGKGLVISPTLQRLTMIVLLGTILFFLSLMSFWFYRFGLIFIYFWIFLIPAVVKEIHGASEQRFFLVVALAVMAVFAFDYFVPQGSHEVIPYVLATNLNI